MNYEWKVAEQLVLQNIRPRLWFGPEDVDKIHAGLDFPAGQRLWKNFVRRAQFFAKLTLEVDDLAATLSEHIKSWHQPSVKIIFSSRDVAAYAYLTRDPMAIEATCRVLANCATVEDRMGSDSRGNRFGYSAGLYLAASYDFVAPLMDAAQRKTFCQWAVGSVIEQTKKQLDPQIYFAPGGNIPIAGLVSAHRMALALWGDREAKLSPDTLADLNRMLETTVGGSIGPDGYPWEDTGYGVGVAACLAWDVEVARRLGVADMAKQLPRYEAFGRAVLHFVQPWGKNLTNTGDHGDDFNFREFILPRLAQTTNDPTLLWLWSTLSYDHGSLLPENLDPILYMESPIGQGRQVPATISSLLFAPLLREAKRPTAKTVPTAFMERGRGIVSFRSSWQDDATYLTFDGSQRSDGAQGHHHASAGHFNLSALGEYFAIDTGRYNNERSDHSVVLARNAERPEKEDWSQCVYAGVLTHYAPDAFVDSASADSTVQQCSYKSERRIGLVKGSGAPAYAWVVDSINIDNQIHEYDWQLQCAPESRIKTSKRGGTVTGFRYGHLLDVNLFLPIFPHQRHGPYAHKIVETFADMSHPKCATYLGLSAKNAIPNFVAKYTRPAAMIHGPVYERPRLVVRFSGWNGRALALLIPRRRGEAAPKLTQLMDAVPGTIAASIVFANVTDTVIIGFDHPMLIAGGVDERGDWCIVRRRNSDGRILQKKVSQLK